MHAMNVYGGVGGGLLHSFSFYTPGGDERSDSHFTHSTY